MPCPIPRAEHPRPDWRRGNWQSLNGPWRFCFDDGDLGLARGWAQVPAGAIDSGAGPFTEQIVVPFCPQSELSGLGDTSVRDVLWYARTFDPPPLGATDRLHLHFGAVDYRADVWVNGHHVVTHQGGHTPFEADATDALVPGEANAVVVRVRDHSRDPSLPRGKQSWSSRPAHIFYTHTSGIWQSVWWSVVDAVHVVHAHLTPDIRTATCRVGAIVSSGATGFLTITARTHDREVAAAVRVRVDGEPIEANLQFDPERLRLWSPDDPYLYEVDLQLVDENGTTRDLVHSYVGMRSIRVHRGKVLLNDEPIFQRLVLDQGYWPDGLMTAPTDAALRRDLELALALGFNGVRKHQKVEDPRWLYWADRLGVLVWGEMANAYEYEPTRADALAAEWTEVLRRDRNHPSVIVWVPLNESSGCRRLGPDQRTPVSDFVVEHAIRMYRLTKQLDPSRPALSNDGWEHATSDLLTIHDYRPARHLARRFRSTTAALADHHGSPPYLPGHRYDGQPLIVSECGGVFFGPVADRFDYQGATTPRELLDAIRATTRALLASAAVEGFCYTQLTDVEQEKNGLLYADRSPKLHMATLRAVIGQPREGVDAAVAPTARRQGRRTSGHPSHRPHAPT